MRSLIIHLFILTGLLPPAIASADWLPGITPIVATAGNRQVTLSFTPPATTANCGPIISYDVQYCTGDIPSVCITTGFIRLPNAVPPITITALTNGSIYRFSVNALTASGCWSYNSSGANPVTPQSAGQSIGAISFLPTTLSLGASTTVSAITTSGLAVSFSSTTPSVCTASGNNVTSITAGTCTIAANQAGNDNYSAAPQVTQSITINKINQTLGPISFSPATLTVVGTSTVSATATSGLAASYSSATPSICTVNGNTVTGVTIGTCTIAANQTGNVNYNAATQGTQNIIIGKGSQTLRFDAAPVIAVGGANTVSATATSGLAVNFSSTTPSVCTVSGSTVFGNATGTCTIAANQSGNANYNAATQVTQSISIGDKANQTISFGSTPSVVVVGGTGNVTATSSSGLAMSFSSKTPGVCTVSGSTVTGVTAGNCTIAADQSGNANYNSATQVTQSLTVKNNQAVSFGAAPTIVFGGTGTVSANATSGLAVSLSSSTPGVCTVSGSIVTDITVGTCIITANQAGDTTYNAATQTQSFTIGKASQTVSFGTAPTIAFGGTGSISAITTSGLAVSFTSATPGVCSVSGSAVTGIAAGACTIAANQAGNVNYNAATQVTQSITVGKGSQSASFGSAPTIVVGGTGTVSASATSGLAVSFTSATPGFCTISGSTVTGISAGACTIAADQAGNVNYIAATQVTQAITIGKANQTIGAISFSPTTLLKSGTVTANATSTSALAVSFSSTTPSVCTVSGNTVTGIAAGTCTIAANQAGNANYNAATLVSNSITIIIKISGSVVDLSTGSPLAAATVTITGGATTQTDASGYFVFNTLSEISTVTISKAGYKGVTLTGEIVTSGSSIRTGLVSANAALLNFIAAPTLPPASTGVIYSQPLTITGGNGPYAFSLAYGSLPAGFTLDPSVGVISGTPSVLHSSTFGIGVTDSLGGYAEREFTIDATLPLIISTLPLHRGMTTTDYSTAINASGGAQPYSFSLLSGVLPSGLTLDSALGMLKGKITTGPGVFNFAIKVIDSEGRNVTQSYSLTVDPLLTQTTTQLNDALVGTAYSQTITATGGLAPYSWSVYSGNLPAGLSLIPATGVITGAPTIATSEPLTIIAIDTLGRSVYKAYSLRALNPLLISTTALPNGFVGAGYSEQVRVTGGIAPYSFSISGQLPTGLTINNSTGIVSGIPSLGGFTNVSITVTDSTWATVQTKTVTMGIQVWSQLTITSASIIPNARKGVVITPIALAARGGATPYTWSVVANQNGSTSYLPQGVSLDPVTGVVSGIPSDTGDFTFTARVTDASGTPVTADKPFYMRVSDTLKAVTKTVSAGAAGIQYSAILSAAGGLKNYTWIVKNGTLPAGLSLITSTGVISGTPTAKIISNVTFEVDDSDTPSQSAQQSLSFEINDALAISETSLPNGRQGHAYLANISPLLGAPSYTWQVTSGNMPPGITLQQNAGIASLQGTPSTPGSYTFTLQVSDSGSPVQKVTRQFTVNIYGPVTITTTALKNALRGMAYSDVVVVSGGTTPYIWQVVSGNLPQGLVFNSTTGTISGTTNAAIGYTASFTVRVTDGGNPSASVDQPYTIQAIDPLLITTSLIQGALQDSPYNVTLAGLGGIAPQTWSIAIGSLPTGITLNSATGVLVGTPTACGNFPLTIQMADSALVPATVQSGFTLVVTCNGSGPYPLSVTLVGTGSGSVNSSPSGIACTSGTCSASFSGGTAFGLLQTPSSNSQFAGWGGDCSGTGACSVKLNAAKSVTATFNKIPRVMIGTNDYSSLQLAYAAAPSTAGVTTTIMLLDGELPESLNMNLGKSITLKGGYNTDYKTKSGNSTVLKGSLKISAGSLKVENVVVK